MEKNGLSLRQNVKLASQTQRERQTDRTPPQAVPPYTRMKLLYVPVEILGTQHLRTGI